MLQVDDLGIINADWASKGLGSHHFVNEIHRLRRQLNPANRLLLRLIRVKIPYCVRVLVVESRGWDHFDAFGLGGVGGHLGFGAHRDGALLVETRSGHGSLVLIRLQFRHSLVLLDGPEEIFVSNPIVWVNLGLGLPLILAQVVHLSRIGWPPLLLNSNNIHITVKLLAFLFR